MSADANTPVLPVTDASARESFMYAQLAIRGVRTDSIGTALTVELSKAWDAYLGGLKAEAKAALSTPPADDVREALTTVEELEALPTRSVVMDGIGEVWRKTVTGLWDCLDGQGDQPIEESSTVLWQSAPPRVTVLWAPGEVRPRGTDTDAEVQDVPGLEGTRTALDSLTTRGGESS